MVKPRINNYTNRLQRTCTRVTIRIYKAIKPIHIYVLLCIAYLLSTSGVIYNVINNPPPYGTERVGPNEEKQKFIASGMMTQYSTEGYVSGFLNVIAGVSVVLALAELRSKRCKGTRALTYLVVFCGACLIQRRRFSIKTGM